MLKQDIGFFEELEGVLANKRVAVRAQAKDPLKLKEAKQPKQKGGEKRERKSAGLVRLTALGQTTNPCGGCPLEAKPKLLAGVGNPETARLLVVTDRVTDLDILNRTLVKNHRWLKFLPLFVEQGLTPDDLYFVAISRCAGQENLDAVQHCVGYLQQDLARPNIKAVLLLGMRPVQLLLDAKLTTIFFSRGKVFDLAGKPCVVTFGDFD